MKQNNSNSSDEKKVVREVKNVKENKATREIGKTGVFMVYKPDSTKFVLVYCGCQISAKEFETETEARHYMNKNVYELVPLMGAILANNMWKRQCAPKTMEEMNK